MIVAAATEQIDHGVDVAGAIERDAEDEVRHTRQQVRGRAAFAVRLARRQLGIIAIHSDAEWAIAGEPSKLDVTVRAIMRKIAPVVHRHRNAARQSEIRTRQPLERQLLNLDDRVWTRPNGDRVRTSTKR